VRTSNVHCQPPDSATPPQVVPFEVLDAATAPARLGVSWAAAMELAAWLELVSFCDRYAQWAMLFDGRQGGGVATMEERRAAQALLDSAEQVRARGWIVDTRRNQSSETQDTLSVTVLVKHGAQVPCLRARERTGNCRLSSTVFELPLPFCSRARLFVHVLRFHV